MASTKQHSIRAIVRSIAGPVTAATLLGAAYLVALGSDYAAARWIPIQARPDYAAHPCPLPEAAAQYLPSSGGTLVRPTAYAFSNVHQR